MTDADKLQLIEAIAREAFSDKWYEVPRYKVDAHRTQALANIFALFEYEGVLDEVYKRDCSFDPTNNPAGKEVINDNITFDDILGPQVTDGRML